MFYGILIISLIITLSAQAFVSMTYSKTRKIKNINNLTGSEVARQILDKNGLRNVQVVETPGSLSDHYDPRSKVVRLSTEVYHSPSIASVAVAAHECGHAIQDDTNYIFMNIRAAIVPIVNFASYAGYFAIMIGFFASAMNLVWFGIIMECVILLFQLITLPVEFNASSRALKQIKELNFLDKKEYRKGRSMLTAAAMTYVASVATTLLEIFRLVLMANRRND